MSASGRKLGLLALVAAMAMALAGCNWTQVGFNSSRTSFNDGEKDLTAAKLHQLDWQWIERLPAGTAPVVYDNVFYVASGATMWALTANGGETVWSTTITNTAGPVEFGDPIITRGRLAAFYNAGSADGIVDFDLKTGAYNDVPTPASGTLIGTPASRGNLIAVSTRLVFGDLTASMVTIDDQVAGISRQGLMTLDAAAVPTSPMILGDRVFVSAGTEVYAFAIDSCPPSAYPTLCAPVWSRELHTQATMPVGVGADGVAIGDDRGNVYVLDAATGAPRWEGSAGTDDVGGIAVARGVLYATARSGELTAFAADGCGTIWCEPLWEAQAGSDPKTAPVVAADVVYVGAGYAVRAFRADGCGDNVCDEIWNAGIEGPSIDSPGNTEIWPVVTGGRVYVAGDDGFTGMLRVF